MACGAEMILANAIEDISMPVAGFERRAYMCSLCNETEQRLVFNIERLIRQQIPVVEDHPFAPSKGHSVPAATYAVAGRNGDRPSISQITHSLPPAPVQPIRTSPQPEPVPYAHSLSSASVEPLRRSPQPEPVAHEARQPRQRFPQRDYTSPFMHAKDRELDELEERRARGKKHK